MNKYISTNMSWLGYVVRLYQETIAKVSI